MGEVVTYSAKMDSETRDRLQALIEQSGLPARDFLNRLVGVYEASEVQESLGQTKEIEALRHHVGRIEDIYLALVKGAADQKEADGIALRQATEEVARAKAAALDARNEATAMVEAAQAEAAQIREQAEVDIQVMRGVVETAHKEVADMRDAVAQARDAQQQSARLARLAEEAATAAKSRCRELEDAAARAQEYRQDAERTRAEAAHAQAKAAKDIADVRDALARAAERAELDREKAVLAARQETMTEIGALREALATAREQKAGLEMRAYKMEQELTRVRNDKAVKSTDKKGQAGGRQNQ